MRRYLAIHRLDPHAPEGDWKDEIEQLAKAARDAGIRPIETFYSEDNQTAYTLYDAPDPTSIQKLHVNAAIPTPDTILTAERIYPELMAEPRRERYS